MSKVINALGKVLRLHCLAIKALETKGRSETDWFSFMTKENFSLVMQLIMAKIPWREILYENKDVLPMLDDLAKFYHQNSMCFYEYDGLFIDSKTIQTYLKFLADFDKTDANTEKKLSLYKIDFQTFFGSKVPSLEDIMQLTDKINLRDLTVNEIIVFRRQYTEQPKNEQLLVAYKPNSILGDESYLVVENKPSCINRFGGNVNNPDNNYVKTIRNYHRDRLAYQKIESIILTNK
ncbi:MAG: hypothetical protein WC422_02780 [Candidatus Paceibacterota bacterium]|jgi:hypothetical protein